MHRPPAFAPLLVERVDYDGAAGTVSVTFRPTDIRTLDGNQRRGGGVSVTITKRVQFNGGARGRRRIEEARPKPEIPAGRVPRISRLMALAIEMDRLVREGVV